MLGMYIAYICKGCRREFILISSEMLAAINTGKYIGCPYCGNKKVKPSNPMDSLKECMEARSYKRVNGALRQK